MVAGERADAQQRRDDRDLRLLGDLPHLGFGAGDERPVPDEQQRTPGLGDEPRRALDHLPVPLHRRLVGAQVDVFRVIELGALGEHVAGDVDEHRAWAPRLRDVEGLAHDAGDVRRAQRQVVVLGYRERNPRRVGFLERVAPDGGPGDLACNRDDGRGVHHGGGQRRHQVRGARPGGRHGDTDLAGGAGVAVGGVAGVLLVAHEDMPQLRVLRQCLVQGQNGAAGQPEHELDSFSEQALA